MRKMRLLLALIVPLIASSSSSSMRCRQMTSTPPAVKVECDCRGQLTQFKFNVSNPIYSWALDLCKWYFSGPGWETPQWLIWSWPGATHCWWMSVPPSHCHHLTSPSLTSTAWSSTHSPTVLTSTSPWSMWPAFSTDLSVTSQPLQSHLLMTTTMISWW